MTGQSSPDEIIGIAEIIRNHRDCEAQEQGKGS
jgi:hypothetical protein